MASIKPVSLPAFGGTEHCPAIPDEIFRNRLDAATARLREASLDVMVVYADREHFANISYLTGFDPRFEEAMLLLDRDGNRLLVVGNENMGFLPEVDLGIGVELFQDFSLLGQTRRNRVRCARFLPDSASAVAVASAASAGSAIRNVSCRTERRPTSTRKRWTCPPIWSTSCGRCAAGTSW